VLVGAGEGISEKIGVDNMFKLGSADTVKGFIKNVLKQAGSEGIEEGISSIISEVSDRLVMQDKSVNRTTDGKGRVDGLSLAQLKKFSLLDAAGNKTDERIPTLDEVLGLLAGRCSVLIEIKDNDSRGIESAVVDAVARNSAWDWVAVHSFSDKVLERFNLLGVPFPLEKLFVFKLPLVPYIYDGTLRRLSLDKYDYVSSFNVHKCFARDGLVVRLHNAGKGVKLWTFGKDDAVRPVNVDGVIVDSPQLWLP
jgi:glycerophosphoryl diester phosphodiesterase